MTVPVVVPPEVLAAMGREDLYSFTVQLEEATQEFYAEIIVGGKGDICLGDSPQAALDALARRAGGRVVTTFLNEDAWVPGPPGKGVRVTVLDDRCRGETSVIDDNYIVVCAGRRYVAHTQVYPKSGMHIGTIKVASEGGGT